MGVKTHFLIDLITARRTRRKCFECVSSLLLLLNL